MRRMAGQAARVAARLLFAAAFVVFGSAVVVTAAAVVLAWRLSEGPIELTGLIPRFDALINAEAAPFRVQVGGVALAWEGWHGGVDRPLDLRLSRLAIANADGSELARIPEAELSISFGWLMLGRVVPRAIEVKGAHIRALRTAAGDISLGLVGGESGAANLEPEKENIGKPFFDLLAELGRPLLDDNARTDHPRWTQLRRVRIADADLVLVDRRLGVIWHAPHAAFDLMRHRAGGVSAAAALDLAFADRTVSLAADAELPPKIAGARLQVSFGEPNPSALAHAVPAFAALAAVRAPVNGNLALELGPEFVWQSGALNLELGQGEVQVAGSALPLMAGNLTVQAVPDHVQLRRLRLVLAGAKGAGPVVQAAGEIARANGHLVGTLDAGSDQVPMADLARYWPAEAARGAHNWVTRNVTAGVARTAHVALRFQANEDGSELSLTELGGQVSGENLTIHWLRPLPPIEHVNAELTLLSPDALLITTKGGREAGTTQTGIIAQTGSVKVTGLEEKDQYGAIEVELVGSVADSIALLREPRLHLLHRHPIELRDPSGQVSAKLALDVLLDDRVTFDDIPLHATGQLSGLHLGGVLAGHDLDRALLDLDVTNDGLKLAGTGDIGAVPAELAVNMDFRAGTAEQVLCRYSVSAATDARQLADFGLDPGKALGGPLGVEAVVVERRNGAGEASIKADLGAAELAVAPLGWSKPRGIPAFAFVHILMNRDRVTGVDRLDLQGAGISLAGALDYVAGKPASVRLERVVVGNTRGAGEIRLAARPDDPVRLSFAGSSLDLSTRFARGSAAKSSQAGANEPDQPWVADLKFGRVLLGENKTLAQVAAHVEDDGRMVRQARIQGQTGRDEGFTLSITPEPSGAGRRLAVEAADAGAFLRTLGILGNMDGGILALSGRYDDANPGRPLHGTAEISSFRLRDAPAATRVLQAMTLYGLVSALRGPGLGMSRMVAPFRLDGDILELDDARASSPSLGFTARGRIDLANRLAYVQGTIVPAYFFNSMLGRIPVLGSLFSPEKGGGVFAATYNVQGRLDDPSVTLNPLAALTPGFLRGLFGILPGGGGPSRSASVP